MSHYIVKTATAQMPSTCKGRYMRVAILKVENGVTDVKMISDRAKGVVEVTYTWEKLSVGTTGKCAYRQALAEARALAEELNAG